MCGYSACEKLYDDSHTVGPYCEAHIQEWLRQFPRYNRIRPRFFQDGVLLPRGEGSCPCTADWPLPAEVP